VLKFILFLFAFHKYHNDMILKPQDVFILLKLVALGPQDWTYAYLAQELFMSVSEVHAGLKRAAAARLLNINADAPFNKRPIRNALTEFVIHGVKYAYPPVLGSITRGIPTAYAAAPLANTIIQANNPPPVWPSPEGTVQGFAFSPLYKSVPKAITKDAKLYELLALTDAIRDSSGRDQNLAIKELSVRITAAW